MFLRAGCAHTTPHCIGPEKGPVSPWRRRKGLMRGEVAIGSQTNGVQFVVAVFDDWDTLHTVLVEMERDTAVEPVALLHARRDVPPKVSASSLLKQTTELRFERSRQHIACTVGHLAEALSARAARGARTLADSLHDW